MKLVLTRVLVAIVVAIYSVQIAIAAPTEALLAPLIYGEGPPYSNDLDGAVARVKYQRGPEHGASEYWCLNESYLQLPANSDGGVSNCGFRYTGVVDGSPGTTLNGVPYSWRIWFERYTFDGTVYQTSYWIFLANTTCPSGYRVAQSSSAQPDGSSAITQYCISLAPIIEPKSCPDGNPIYASAGVKRQTEVDFRGSGSNSLKLERTYRSDSKEWVSNYDAFAVDYVPLRRSFSSYISPNFLLPDSSYVTVERSDSPGVKYLATRLGGNYLGTTYGFGLRRGNGQHVLFGSDTDAFQPYGDTNDRVNRILDSSGTTIGFSVYNAANDSVEKFDVTGRLQRITFKTGQTQTLTYSDANTSPTIASSAGKLIAVTDNYGHQISFTYDSRGRRITMTDSLGGLYTYGYNEASAIKIAGASDAGMLTSVTYPDGTKRVYWYNEQDKTSNTNLPFALTGITDENGIRYSTYMYDAGGRAISTEHAGGVNRVTLANITGSSTAVTDAVGTTRIRKFITVDNVSRDAGQNQPAGAGCAAASSAMSYDANGNVTAKTDFDGVVTTYTYDLSRNLEITRVKASGTPQASKTMTSWHANYRLPTAVSEPLKRTTYVYDGNGNVLSRTEQATLDADGSLGFTALVVGAARTWSFTYNALGQVLTMLGPRTDIVDQTSYAYDASGNLTSVTNPAGHVTQFTQYDRAGRVRQMIDPKGVVTDISYTPRGWVSTVTTTAPGGAGRTTSYTYDNVGQLTGVAQPDGTTLSYRYDAAHRLVGVTDAKGNSVSYTLDNAGNRIAEEIKDPNGVLQRSISRSFDALNRVQQVTGSER